MIAFSTYLLHAHYKKFEKIRRNHRNYKMSCKKLLLIMATLVACGPAFAWPANPFKTWRWNPTRNGINTYTTLSGKVMLARSQNKEDNDLLKTKIEISLSIGKRAWYQPLLPLLERPTKMAYLITDAQAFISTVNTDAQHIRRLGYNQELHESASNAMTKRIETEIGRWVSQNIHHTHSDQNTKEMLTLGTLMYCGYYNSDNCTNKALPRSIRHHRRKPFPGSIPHHPDSHRVVGLMIIAAAIKKWVECNGNSFNAKKQAVQMYRKLLTQDCEKWIKLDEEHRKVLGKYLGLLSD